MAEPGGKQRKNVNGTVTMRRLLDFAMAEYARSGPIDFSLDNVLRDSGVSRGSFYHHFGSRARIIARCEDEHLNQVMQVDADSARQLLSSGLTGSQIFDILMAGVLDNVTAEAKARRRQRIQTIAVAITDDGIREVINQSQAKGIEFLVELIGTATKQGLLDPVVDIEGLSYLLPSMFLGLIYIDHLDDDELARRVCQTIVDTLRAVLRPN